MSYEFYESEFLENKFYEFKASYVAAGYSEEDAEIGAIIELEKFMEDYG